MAGVYHTFSNAFYCQRALGFAFMNTVAHCRNLFSIALGEELLNVKVCAQAILLGEA